MVILEIDPPYLVTLSESLGIVDLGVGGLGV